MPVPTAVPVVSPAHLFRLEILQLCLRGDGGVNVLIRRLQPFISGKWPRRQRRGLRGRGQRGGTGGNSNGKFQKVASFHDISLFCCIASDAGKSLNAAR